MLVRRIWYWTIEWYFSSFSSLDIVFINNVRRNSVLVAYISEKVNSHLPLVVHLSLRTTSQKSQIRFTNHTLLYWFRSLITCGPFFLDWYDSASHGGREGSPRICSCACYQVQCHYRPSDSGVYCLNVYTLVINRHILHTVFHTFLMVLTEGIRWVTHQ